MRATGMQSASDQAPLISILKKLYICPGQFPRVLLQIDNGHSQPVTRGDIEDIRGVTVNSLLIKQLEDRGWIEVIGHKEAIGRPALFATTRHFLDDLGLESLDQLPLLDASDQQAGMLEALNACEPALQAELDISLATAPTQNDGGVAAAAVTTGDISSGRELFFLTGTQS